MKPYLIILLSEIGILICLAGVYYKLILSAFKKHWKEIFSLGIIISLFFVRSSGVLFTEKFRVLHDNWIHAYPLFHFLNDSIVQTGAMPYWNPYIDGGQPTFLSLNNYFLFHLPHLIAYLIYPFIYKHISTLLLYWWVIIMSNLLFSLGCYFLFRLLFSNWQACLFGFIVCLFSGITAGTLHQEQIMASSFYIPWAWGGLIIFSRTKKMVWGILSSVLIGISLINHYPHLIVYFWAILLISFLVIRWSDFRCMWRASWKQWLFMLAIGIPIILIIASPTFVLYGEYKSLVVSPYRMGENIAVTYDYLVKSKDTNSMSFNTLFHYIFPKTSFDLSLLGYFRLFPLDSLIFYIGLLPLFFAAYELFRGTSSSRKVYALSAVIMFFFALGANSYGYYLLYKFLPFANLQRLPVHLGNYINLFLVLLSVSGVKTFLEQKTYSESNYLFSAPKAVFLIALPVIYQPLSDVLKFFTPGMTHHFLIETVILISMLIIFLLVVFSRPSKLAIIIIIFLVLLFDVTKYYRNVLSNERDVRKTGFNYYSSESSWKEYKSLFETLKLETPYLALLNKEPVIDINNNSLLVFSEYRKFIKQYRPLLADSARNREMYRAVRVISEEQMDVFKREGPSMNSIQSGAEVKVKSYQPNEVQFEVKAEKPAYLYYMDNYDKGWSVYVNGNKKDLIKVFSFKAVEFMQGENKIVFSYKPSWRWVLHTSLSVFWLGLGGCLIYIYWHWIKKQRGTVSANCAVCS